MRTLSSDLQAGIKPAAEHIGVIRRFCILVALAAAIGFGYAAFVSPRAAGTSFIDVGFISSVIVFLVLLVSVLGDQLKRTSGRERTEAERNTDA